MRPSAQTAAAATLRSLLNFPCGGNNIAGGRIFDSNAGFFLSDGFSLSLDAAYATAEQMRGLIREDRKHFLRLTLAFVIELLSSSDSLASANKKMELWMANGAELAWLIDPYRRNALLYERGLAAREETSEQIAGSGPVEGLVLDLASVWSLFED